MFKQKYSSQLLEKAVDEFASLPGIGRKSALRLALHLLKQPVENIERFGTSFIALRKGVRYCNCCNMITDGDICSVCADSRRDKQVICVVESIRDVLSIENLLPGMELTGTVRNVIDFGVFVDIGVHQDGLVHISEVCNRRLRHPSELVKVGDIVKVVVLSVDEKRKRISLSMKQVKQ